MMRQENHMLGRQKRPMLCRRGVGTVLVLSWLMVMPTRGWSQAAALPSLDPSKALHQYVHEVWDQGDGLPPNAIHAITQTRDGYLWLGTQGALIRFDGVRFTVFDRRNVPALTPSIVRCLLESRDGTLWIGTEGGGLVRYRDGVFEALTTDDGLPNNRVAALYEDREGRLWIGTGNGLARFHDEAFKVYTRADGLPENSVLSIYQARDGTLLAGTRSNGLARLDNDGFRVLHPANGAVNQAVISIYEEPQGGFWLGLRDTTQFRYNGGEWLGQPGLENIRAFLEDRAGTLWIGSSEGLTRVIDGAVTQFTEQHGLTDNRVLSLFEDREGSLWIGTYGGGLNRLKDGRLRTISVRDGLIERYTNTIYEDAEGTLWIGTNGGLTRYHDGGYTSYTTRDGLAHNSVHSILEDRAGQLWIGTDGGLNRLEDGRFTRVEGLLGIHIMALYEDRAGDLWIGTRQGLNRLRDGIMTAYTTDDGLPHPRIIAIHEDRSGTLWVATRNGMAHVNHDKITLPEDLQEVWIRTIHEDAEDILWLGTFGKGLYRYDAGALTTYNLDNGLPDDFVWHILEDDQDQLWMCSDNGIFSVPKADLNAVARGERTTIRSAHYGTQDGMADVECVGLFRPGAVKTQSGDLWFPTTHGAVRVEPKKPNTLAPPVVIEAVLVGEAEMDVRAPVVLSPEQRDVEIQYTGLSFRRPDQVAFKYQLEGYDAAWQSVGTRRSAFYTNLRPGSYTFRVQASNDDGLWNEIGTSLALTVKPYFYETMWFYGLCGLLLLLLGYAGYWQRTRSMRRRNAELATFNARLNQEVKERKHAEILLERQNDELERQNDELERFTYTVSHDLKTPLVTIQGFLGLLQQDALNGDVERMASDVRHIKNAADKMGLLLSDLLELSRVGRLMNAPEAVALSELAHEAAEMVAGRIQARGVTVEIDPAMPVVYGDRLRLLEVYQNLIENAAKFMNDQTEAQIDIGASKNGAEVRCYVRDNGIGIAPKYHERIFGLFNRLHPSVEGTGIGLALVKRIVEVHGGRIWVESDGEGQGSTFFFTLASQTGANDEVR